MTRVQGVRTWIEIDTKAIKHNFETFRNLLGENIKIAGVVKSNAYGHGFIDFSKELEKLGVDVLAVDSVSEALRLRKEEIKTSIVVLGYTLPEKIVEATDDNISLTISQFENLQVIENLNIRKPVKVHIKVDTGMHRQGFLEEDAPKLIQTLKNLSKKIEVTGLFTHFASAGDLDYALFTEVQIKRFLIWKEIFNQAGFTPITHASATSGMLAHNNAHLDMVRIGAGLYGVWPSEKLQSVFGQKINLKPVLTWKSVLSEKKKIKKGEKIGYDCTEELKRDTIIAVVPIGYWHGFGRGLSSKCEVLVRGKRAKVLGRVSMDMIVIDITDIPEAEVLDEVVLIGKQGSQGITLREMAKIINSSPYEVATRLNPLIKKVYI